MFAGATTWAASSSGRGCERGMNCCAPPPPCIAIGAIATERGVMICASATAASSSSVLPSAPADVAAPAPPSVVFLYAPCERLVWCVSGQEEHREGASVSVSMQHTRKPGRATRRRGAPRARRESRYSPQQAAPPTRCYTPRRATSARAATPRAPADALHRCGSRAAPRRDLG